MTLCVTCTSAFSSERFTEVLDTESDASGEHHPNITAVRTAVDEGCDVCTLVLYWMRDDGSDEQQLSFTLGVAPDGGWFFQLVYPYVDSIQELNFRLYPLDEGT